MPVRSCASSHNVINLSVAEHCRSCSAHSVFYNRTFLFFFQVYGTISCFLLQLVMFFFLSFFMYVCIVSYAAVEWKNGKKNKIKLQFHIRKQNDAQTVAIVSVSTGFPSILFLHSVLEILLALSQRDMIFHLDLRRYVRRTTCIQYNQITIKYMKLPQLFMYHLGNITLDCSGNDTDRWILFRSELTVKCYRNHCCAGFACGVWAEEFGSFAIVDWFGWQCLWTGDSLILII